MNEQLYIKKRQNQHLPVLTLPYNGLLVNSFILFINIHELKILSTLQPFHSQVQTVQMFDYYRFSFHQKDHLSSLMHIHPPYSP